MPEFPSPSPLSKKKALERIFVFQAVEYGYLTDMQLMECIEIHDKCEPPIPLLTICKQKKYLKPSQVRHLMSKRLDKAVGRQLRALSEAEKPRPKPETPVDDYGPVPTLAKAPPLPREEKEEFQQLLSAKDAVLETERKKYAFLKRKNDEVEKKLAEYEQIKQKELKEVVGRKQREIENLESELTCYRGLHEKSDQQLKTFQENLAQEQKNMQSIQASLKRERQKSQGLFNLIEQGSNELRETEEKRSTAEAELEKQIAEVKYIQGKLEKESKERTQYKEEFEKTEATRNKLQNDLDSLKQDLHSTEDNRIKLEEELEQLKSDKKKLAQNVGDLEEKIKNHQGSGAEFQEFFSVTEDLQKDHAKMEEQLERQRELEEKLEKYKKLEEGYKEAENKLKEQIETAKKDKEEAEEKLRHENRKIKDELEKEKSDLEESFHKEKAGLEADLKQYKQKGEKLESKLDQYQESLKNWDELEKQREELEKKLQEEQQRSKNIEKEKSGIEKKLQKMRSEVQLAEKFHTSGELENGSRLMGSGGENYIIQKILGKGGMGIAYSALRVSDEKIIVIKTLIPEAMTDLKVLMRFVQEARTILAFDHPNLVGGYDFYQGKDLSYFVMEFLDGDSVEDMLDEQGLLDTIEGTEVILGIARALQYLEENNLVHRDVKPANIVVNKDGTAKLVDFGIVKMTDRTCSLTTEGIILGTPYYLSPEQTYQTNVDIRSDIYSLGATYYHMVVGEVPFPGDNPIDVIQKRLNHSPKPGKVKSDLPRHVCNVIERMMNKNAKKRHSSAGELVKDLETVLKKIRR